MNTHSDKKKQTCSKHKPVNIPDEIKFYNAEIKASGCSEKSKTVLVFRDSFMSAMEPFLSETFSKVIYVWLYPTDEMLELFIKQENPDIIIEERVERGMRNIPRTNWQTPDKIFN